MHKWPLCWIKTVSEKASLYDRNNQTEDKPFIAYNERNQYASTVDIALYKSYQAYNEISAKYRSYVVMAGVEDEIALYPYGPSFMTYLAGGNTVSFDDIQKDIYYLLAAGTKVEDYMGYVADDYNFDFVADGLTMKVGEAEYSAEKISDNKYGFVLNTESKDGYDYTPNL